MPTADSPGDLLLYAVSAWGQATQERFRGACDALATSTDPGRALAPARHIRAAALRALLWLGHCAASDAGVSVLPAHLAELPAAGLPQALLCGARGPHTLPAARAAAEQAGADLLVQPQVSSLGPARLLLTGPSRTALRAAASALGMEYRATPAAWATLSADRDTLHSVQERLSWKQAPELNWPRRDFDTTTCTFREPGDGPPRPWRLSSYLHPNTQQVLCALWRGERSATVGRDWGRHLSLYHQNRTVLNCVPDSRIALSPASAPLPAALAQALTQCSGLLPDTATHPIGEVVRWNVHTGVPADVFQEVHHRLAPNR